MFMISWDIVETRRSSSAFKRFCSSSLSPEPSSSSPPPTKRPKVKIDAAIEFAAAAEPAESSSAARFWLRIKDRFRILDRNLETDTKPEADVLETPTIAGEVVTDGENSKAGKKRAKAPWAKLLCLAVCSACNTFLLKVWSFSSCPTSSVGFMFGSFIFFRQNYAVMSETFLFIDYNTSVSNCPTQRSIDCNYGDIAEEIIIPSVQFSYTQFLNNGNFVGAASGKTFPALDTRTKEVIANVAEGDAEDINRAMKAARKSIDEGAWP
ncbi:hypothetical protein IGI04_020850 [Brassica rapa subsp. trilocularis]|uniref:Aldehyde dehydrogenase domain-containing protein n=1 Tax=Brassica rapa subsp. trilocularis TaxID=1813537 RepID=A0ABQ7MN70_BRACM|nr:hypothetical protein IGI04_020850 [Brassica rapa subsp. trilocularis]